MKEVVTGASGFIGRKLVKELADRVHTISHERIQLTKLQPFDRLFFLSAYGNMANQDTGTREDMQKIVRANVSDLAYMVDEASAFDFRSFVYVSTSSVKLPIQTTYSRTKKMGEELLLAYMERLNLPIAIVRPFSITGVGEQEKHLIPTLIRSCLEGERINFVPEPVHDFLDVDDFVSGLINLSENSARGIFELGSGVQHTNQEVLEIVEKVTGKRAKVTVVPNMRKYDTTDWVSKNFRSRSWGWLPKKSLEQSVAEMVEAYDKN